MPARDCVWLVWSVTVPCSTNVGNRIAERSSGLLVLILLGGVDFNQALDCQAAVDLNNLAGDVAGVVGKQEAGDAGDFIRFGKAA